MNRIPKGCKNIGAELAEAMERCRASFLSIFASYGYRPFWPSGLQLLETALDKLSPYLKRRIIPLSSPHGEPCCLRTDITLGVVAYCAAHHPPHERPLRISYADRLFRIPSSPNYDIEGYQLGAELIGWEGRGADVEIISLLLEFLEKLGLRGYRLVLGDANVIATALEGVPTPVSEELLSCLQGGNYSTYYATLKKEAIDGDRRKLLQALPNLKGAKNVIDEASVLFGSFEPLASLKSIADSLEELGYGSISFFDLGLVRELGYYSGPVFDVFLEGVGVPIGGGGRYDRLLAQYGVLGQAVGFALNLERLASALSRSDFDAVPKLLLWCGPSSPSDAVALARHLVSLDIGVEMSWHSDASIALDLARQRGLSWWCDASTRIVKSTKDQAALSLDEWLLEVRQ
ncbi:MAG TPA: ATP phosphoribosyltransferase regulatory subunit [Thermosynergistes sp.]|nr:ATP phosphoribosyltransferase regulatory subunit [Thermosynergistes sp.]HPZ75634.1 ATP phosphoribosyltransferase regulatory subunit [Thermosynergistes sp.]